MTFTAIVVSHQNFTGLQRILLNLKEQTRRPDEVLVYGTEPFRIPNIFKGNWDGFVFAERPHRGDWGHADRAEGVATAKSDYVGFFNDDDSYNDLYLQLMLDAAEREDADVVYCDWTTIPHCEFKLGSSTSGNFIVRTDLARRVGYPATPVYENDGHFINALAAASDTVVKVPYVLYRHNRQ